MALKAPATPLSITATQGSADAFVQGSVLTGLQSRQAYNLRRIGVEFSPNLSRVDNADLEVALTRRTKTAMPNISDVTVIFKCKFETNILTSGALWFPDIFWFDMVQDVPIVEETLYMQLDSNATTLTHTAIMRLEVDDDTISDIERLTLLTRGIV